MQIKEELRKKIYEWLAKNPLEYYGDYTDKLEIESVQKLMDDSQSVENELWENSLDYVCDMEYELMKQLQKEFPELEEYEDAELREEFMDHIVNNVSFLESCIRHTSAVRIRVVIQSNNDAMVDNKFLIENVSELQKLIKIANGKTGDNYYDQIARLLKGKFTITSMKQEMENCTTSWNQLIFYFSVDVRDLVDINQKKWTKIKIPKNVMCGFFDSCNGAGSVLEVKLIKDFWLKRQHGKSKYDTIQILLDEAKYNKYGVEETYGLCNIPEISLQLK